VKAWNEWLGRKICDKGTQTVNSLPFYSEENLKEWMIAGLPAMPCGNEQPQSCFEQQVDEPCAGYDLTRAVNELYAGPLIKHS